MVSMRDFSLELLAQNRLDSVLDATLRFAGEAIPARRAVLMLRERRGDQLVSRAFRSFRPGEPARPIRICESIVKAVFENRASLITPDAQLDRRFNFSKSIFEDGIHSAICSPLWNDQKVTGLIYMDRSPDEAPFRKEELCLLSSLANMAALKVENTRLFEEALEKRALEEQLALASEIQRSLLPAHNPHVDGFDVAAFHVPCYQIGGDYYDFFELGENRIGLALGDVSGKGAGAALLMASLRAFLSSLVKQNRPLPSLLSELSAFIYRSSPFEKFITFFFAVLDTSSGRIRYVNAGHNAPLIVGHSEEAIRLDATGLPLGIFPDCRYEEGTARIRPGDLLVIYTDGVTERSTASEEEFGENRLVELLVTRKSAPAQEISEVVLASVDEFASGEVPQDDMTLVVVKRLQKGIALTE
jgi:serine phosphatase RsbU (regulator of sigma subunit)